MQDLLALLDAAPSHFKDRARDALLEIVSEYEDWLACGSPDMDRYNLTKFTRMEFKTPLKFQAFIQQYLKDTE